MQNSPLATRGCSISFVFIIKHWLVGLGHFLISIMVTDIALFYMVYISDGVTESQLVWAFTKLVDGCIRYRWTAGRSCCLSCWDGTLWSRFI